MTTEHRRRQAVLRLGDGEPGRASGVAQAARPGVIGLDDQRVGPDLGMPDHLAPRQYRGARNVVGFEAVEPLPGRSFRQHRLDQLQALVPERLPALGGAEPLVLQQIGPFGRTRESSHSLSWFTATVMCPSRVS